MWNGFVMQEIKVAFVFEALDSKWLGGLNYYINLVNAISSNGSSGVKVVLFSGSSLESIDFKNNVERIQHPMLRKGSAYRLIRKVVEKIFGKDIFLYVLLRQHNIKMLSHAYPLWSKCKLPAIPWIADFQHKRLPEMFDKAEIERRNRMQAAAINSPGHLFLSSQSAAQDCDKYFTDRKCMVHILRFVSGPPNDWQPMPLFELKVKYSLPDVWFHLPNQYWLHKNHEVVVHAISELKKKSLNVHIVSTGNTSYNGDSRAFSEIKKILAKNKISESEFRVLGPIPYSDMLSIMYYSAAVINPSKFEGWSTSVEEGKSFWKKNLSSLI